MWASASLYVRLCAWDCVCVLVGVCAQNDCKSVNAFLHCIYAHVFAHAQACV